MCTHSGAGRESAPAVADPEAIDRFEQNVLQLSINESQQSLYLLLSMAKVCLSSLFSITDRIGQNI